jgi:hypothetical protein
MSNQRLVFSKVSDIFVMAIINQDDMEVLFYNFVRVGSLLALASK